MLSILIWVPQWDVSNEYPQHIILWRKPAREKCQQINWPAQHDLNSVDPVTKLKILPFPTFLLFCGIFLDLCETTEMRFHNINARENKNYLLSKITIYQQHWELKIMDSRFLWSSLTHISLASLLWDIGNQCRPRSDAALSNIWSRSSLFAYKNFNYK